MAYDSEMVKRPEVLLGDLLRRHAQGELSNRPRFFHRAVVLAVDMDGGMLSGHDASGPIIDGVGVDGRPRSYGRILGPTNPAGSVKALLIDSARDSFFDESSARVLWPLFPTDQFALPIIPGEHVYTIFEDEGLEHGLWVCRISGQDSANFMPGSEWFSSESQQGRPRLASLFGDGPSHGEPPRSDDSTSTRVRPTGRKLSSLF